MVLNINVAPRHSPWYYSRHAEIIDQIRVPGMCSCFGWDKDGDLLAAITDKSSNLLIWDANTRRSQWLESGMIML